MTLAARNAKPDELPSNLLAGRDYVLISVADTGVGMNAETLRRATEPFFTTKPAGKGTGLGLASAHGFAQQSGGTLRLRSAPGQGTTIELFLPRAGLLLTQNEGGSDTANAAVLDPARHGNATILLVDDDDGVRLVTAGMLRDLGYTVIEAPSAEMAEALAHVGGVIDMLITDVVMAGVPGPVLASRLREEQPGLPVLYITGYPGGAALGRDPMLGKPFTDIALARALLECLGRLGTAREESRPAPVPEENTWLRERLRQPILREAYLRWLALRGAAGGPLPNSDGFEIDALPRGAAEAAFLAEVCSEDGADGFHFLHVGSTLEERLGRTLTGETVGGVSEEDVHQLFGGSIAAAYRRCAEGRGPLYDYARFALGDGRPVLFERLVLPLSADGVSVTHLVGIALFTNLAAAT